MRVLVTGARGFIGRRLCAALRAQGHDLLEFDVSDGDLKQQEVLSAFDRVDFVFHLAARTYVPDSWLEPHSYYANNVMGTVTALEYCRAHQIPFVTLSTYVYGEPRYLPLDEGHPLKAVSPYHESKLLCESLCAFYAEQYKMDIRVLRPFNVYGAGQREEFLLPKIMKQALDPSLSEIVVFDLEPKRDYIYIDDLIQALVCTLKPWKGYELFNIGTGESVSVKEAIESVLRATGIHKPYKATNQSRQGEVSDCRADIRLAERVLDYRPRFKLEEGLKQWYREISGDKA